MHFALLAALCQLPLAFSAAAWAQAPPITTLHAPVQASADAKPQNGAPPQPDPALAHAKSLADHGRAVEAEAEVRQYLESHPHTADAHFLLGYILFREIQEAAATPPAEEASDASAPGAQRKQNSPEAASTQSHASSDNGLTENLAAPDVSFRQAKAGASLAEFTEGAKYHTPSAFDLKIVALDYVLLDNYVDADKWLTKMLEWAPRDSEGWYYLGRTKYNENRFEEAVKAFQNCLKLDPKNVKAEDNLGLSYAGLSRADEAASAYRKAIEWQKDAATKNPGPFIDMASLLLDQNRSAEAVTYLHQAIEISPRDFKAHELLGKAYSRMDQLAQAQTELEKAMELAPQNTNLPCILARLYRKRGLIDKAKAQLDRCAELNGTHSSPATPRP